MSNKNEQGGMDVKQRNVYNKPLHQHSHPNSSPSPSDSALKSGFCNNQSPVAAVLTDSFLDFTASHGTDLRKQGLGPGQKFCIEAGRWKEALGSGNAPQVQLGSTHVSALDSVSFDDLKKFEAPHPNEYAVWPDGKSRGFARESGEIGGKEPKA